MSREPILAIAQYKRSAFRLTFKTMMGGQLVAG